MVLYSDYCVQQWSRPLQYGGLTPWSMLFRMDVYMTSTTSRSQGILYFVGSVAHTHNTGHRQSLWRRVVVGLQI